MSAFVAQVAEPGWTVGKAVCPVLRFAVGAVVRPVAVVELEVDRVLVVPPSWKFANYIEVDQGSGKAHLYNKDESAAEAFFQESVARGIRQV